MAAVVSVGALVCRRQLQMSKAQHVSRELWMERRLRPRSPHWSARHSFDPWPLGPLAPAFVRPLDGGATTSGSCGHAEHAETCPRIGDRGRAPLTALVLSAPGAMKSWLASAVSYVPTLCGCQSA